MKTIWRDITFVGLFLLLYSAECLWADIYVYKDDNGVRHFTNTKPNDNYKLYLVSHEYDFIIVDYNGNPVSGAIIKYSLKGYDTKTGTATSKEDGKIAEKLAIMSSGPSSIDYEIIAEGYYTQKDRLSISDFKTTNKSEKVVIRKPNDTIIIPIEYFHKDFSVDLNLQLKNNILQAIDQILAKGTSADYSLEKRSINLIKLKDNVYIQFKFIKTMVYDSSKFNKNDIGNVIFDDIIRKILGPLNDFVTSDEINIYGYDLIVIAETKCFSDINASKQKIEYRFLIPEKTVKKYNIKDISGQNLLDGSIFLMDNERSELKLH